MSQASILSGVQGLKSARRALLVIAHPDDESMFFAPTLHVLHNQGAVVRILCLSNGDGDGLGVIREKELLAACRVLQIPTQNVTIVNHPQLQDGMARAWPAEAVAHQVEQQLKQHPCDTVFTFDAHGVSGHLNHRGVHHGVRLLLESQGRQLGVQAGWQLVSERLLHKYGCLLSAPLSALLLRPGQALVTSARVWASVRAMAAHKSQWVWYRKLFVMLSSYTYVNRLQPMALG
ncbi:N-acetylglucosaminylphosphatidylinositol de-N-acetylase family protein [Scenedesmus sp. NREL 46B-D3]|nr:N-acetylglucosaminylphosphatidylinositol de-N-acetylase family protein [Scenedesmus sp. NREL 46B-D3]